MTMDSDTSTSTWPLEGINPIDQDALKATVDTSQPVKNFMIENFLDESLANFGAASPLPDKAVKKTIFNALTAFCENNKILDPENNLNN